MPSDLASFSVVCVGLLSHVEMYFQRLDVFHLISSRVNYTIGHSSLKYLNYYLTDSNDRSISESEREQNLINARVSC